ncbi:hypothetical protein E4U10_004529 [Claviceps purpurea]|nr:hypothetical protein E4U10_004529 [Claviceps purpurea]
MIHDDVRASTSAVLTHILYKRTKVPFDSRHNIFLQCPVRSKQHWAGWSGKCSVQSALVAGTKSSEAMASSADGMRAAPTPCRDNDRMIGIRPEYGEILFKDGVAARRYYLRVNEQKRA